MPSVHIVTLGCPKNRVDSEVMLGGLSQDGWELAERPDDADVIVVNTCAFIEASKEESVNAVLEAARHKSGRARKLVVAGCLAQRYPEQLAAELPEVDHFVGTSGYARLPELLKDVHAPRQVIPDPDYIHSAATPRINSLPSYTAYLKIAEGCDNECAFCIIPALRGDQRSRPIADVVAEAELLARQGARELNLVAQDLTAYGHDLPGRPRLHALLHALAEVKGPRWIRLHYAYPRNFPDELVSAIRDIPTVVKYLDMPVQHASDRLLRAMRRGRNAAFLRELLGKLRAEVPGIVLRTSLIVGLPGETDEDFALLLDFIREMRFERLGIFRYSQEEGTAAAEMEGQLPEEIKEERWRIAMEAQAGIHREINEALVGSEVEVLVEGPHEETEHLLVGRHAGQAPEIDGQVIISDLADLEVSPGDLVRVRVDEAHDYDLVGAVTGLLERAPAAAPSRDAGGILLEVDATDFSVTEKPSGGGPVTAADERANALIVARLRRAFPGDGVVAEESEESSDAGTHARCWFVDPLDGTREFVNRNGEFAVHIGLAIDGEARLGVVYRPVQERMFSGVVGGECLMESPSQQRVLHVSQISRPEDLRVVVSRSHRNQRALRVQQRLAAPRVMQAGSVGIKCSMIAEGLADVYVHVSARSYRWDSCAPEAVLRAAGGRLTDLTGKPYRYDGGELQNGRGLLGCNEAAFERVVAVTTEVAREAGLLEG